MKPSRILIVEDTGQTAEDLNHQLQSLDYEVVAFANSSGQAISLAVEHNPDLILIDTVSENNADGIATYQKIAESLATPIILLASQGDTDSLAYAERSNAYGFLTKPLQPEALRSAIEVALYKSALEKRLKHEGQWFAKSLQCMTDAVITTDTEANLQFMNLAAERLTGWQLNQALGKPISDIITILDEESRSTVENPITRCLRVRGVIGLNCDTLIIGKNGKETPIDSSAAPLLHENGGLLGGILVFRDITERRQIENSLKKSEERFHSAYDHANIGMALVAINGQFMQANDPLCKILECTKPELLNSNLTKVIDNEYSIHSLNQHLLQLLSNELPCIQMEVKCQQDNAKHSTWLLLNAGLVSDGNGRPLYFIVQAHDITGRKRTEQQLVYVTHHDPLTGLFNRAQFHERFKEYLVSAKRRNTKMALMLLDLDRFKIINETLSHKVGDLLLQAVSDRLKRTLRINDILARLSGDKFVLLLGDLQKADEVGAIAQKLIATITQPYNLQKHDIVITANIGISVYPDDGKDSHTLQTHADTALYLAKERGTNNYQFYTSEMTVKALERMTIERGLHDALKNNQLRLHYQPQVDLNTGKAVNVEALVRWEHPVWGIVPPEQFLAVAETTGLIVDIGKWVLRTACLQAKVWQDNNGPFSHVAVNVSPRQFFEPDLFDMVKETLQDIRLKPSSLELEITEFAVMKDPDKAIEVLQKLHGLGVKISIDDFGTGYSSLTHLKQLPVHTIKIDRSFIQDIVDDDSATALVRAIIALTHELNMQVTAEGVETKKQLEFLKAQHCDKLQGYLLCQPYTAETLESGLYVNDINEYFSNLH